jgi:biotin carboxyl carrier protein
MPYNITLGEGRAHEVQVARHGTRATVTIDGCDHAAALCSAGDHRELTFANATVPLWAIVDRDTIWVHAYGRAWELTLVDPIERALEGGASEGVAAAPMPGTVITVAVAAGDAVTTGQPLVVIESMKMQSEIVAMRDGVVDRVFLSVGDTFERGAPLASLVSEDGHKDEAGEG